MTSIPPNQTIYLRNIDEKIRKEELKESLYNMCISYGRIVDIVALKTMKMRGQAFVVFWDIVSATNAIRHLNGISFYDKPLTVEYALSKSVAVMKLEHPDTLVNKPENISAERRKKMLGISTDNGNNNLKRRVDNTISSDKNDKSEDNKRQIIESCVQDNDLQAPNNILFAGNLPDDTTEEMLAKLFNQYPGFKEVRMVPGKKGIAFIEYDDDTQASDAKEVLNGFNITSNNVMSVSFVQNN